MLPAVRANNERAHALGQAHEGIGVLPEQERAVQRWLDVRWNPSATMKLTVGVLPNGEPRENAHESQGCHLMTPATEMTTHYFWAQGRNWGARDPAMDAPGLDSPRMAFDTQDKPMIEAVQRNLGTSDLDSLSPVMLATDGGPVRARRVLKQLIADEAKAVPKLLEKSA